MDQAGISDSIRTFIIESFLDPSRAATLSNSDDLLTILDSLQALRLFVQIETLYGTKVEDADLTPENLGSIDKIAAYVARKLP